MLVIKPVKSEEQIEAVRQLLWTYGNSRNFDSALGDYDTELAELPGKYNPPEGLLLLASVEGKPAGCIAYRKIGTDICEMKRMYVSPEHRGKGIGKKLAETLIDRAKVAGYTKMNLDTHPTMHTALSLYQALGFKEIERYNDNPIPGVRFFGRLL